MTVTDGNSVTRGSLIEADLCIVGAGPAGIAIAREFAGTARRILVVEGGPLEFNRSLRSPVRIVREHLWGEQSLARGESVGRPYYRLDFSRARAFGGSSRALFEHGLRAFRLSPIDFDRRPEVGLPGWPFSVAELAEYYDRAHAVCGLGEYREDATSWMRDDAMRPPSVTGVECAVMQHGHRDHFFGYLDELRAAQNVQTFLHAVVTEIATLPETPGQVSHLEVGTLGGNRFRVTAPLYVLAAGGIENARLLLASNRVHRQGLGNDYDVVGRYFMEHPHVVSGFVRPRDRDAARALIPFLPHEVEGNGIRYLLQPSEAAMRRERLLNVAFELNTTYAARADRRVHSARTIARAVARGPLGAHLLPHVGYAIPALPRIASVASRRFRARPELDTFEIHAMAEQAPHPESRVTLSAKQRDRLGMPRAKLDWRVSDGDIDSLRRAQRLIDEALQRAGLGVVDSLLDGEGPPAGVFGGWHHMGTTRMHPDPRTGVVDEHSRVHSLRNLYVAGSSVFPSSGCANPTLTIVALALRLADHLRRQLAPEPVRAPLSGARESIGETP